MKTLTAVLCMLSLSVSLTYSQGNSNADDQALRKLVLLSDVKTLAIEITKLDDSLARAVAYAEVADAAWTLDREWAKNSLRDAYRLTYPPEEEQSKLQTQRRDIAPKRPTEIDRARRNVRRNILSVARRDNAFADQLIRDGAVHITKDDRQLIYAQLARLALDEGDDEAARRSIEQSMQVDPIGLGFAELVNDLAIRDRAAADKLILQCIGNLAGVELFREDFSIFRSSLMLRWLVFPNSIFPDPNKRIPNPGPEVMRAYVQYIIESLTALERRFPGSLKNSRSTLLTAWLPLNAYAPELKERFMQLEALSRTPGKDASLPTQSNEDADKERFRKDDNDALNGNEPSDRSIASAIARENFETARKLISKLPDGERKTEFTEQVNTKEAISLAKKDKLLEAQSQAERLTKPSSILQVYPLLIQRYAAIKDQMGASAALRQAILKLKNAGPEPVSQSFGMPASFGLSPSETDPVVVGLGKLAKAVMPVDSLLASEAVDEMVLRSNTGQLDTKYGRTGIDSDVFNKLAGKDEIRARDAAERFKNPLRRIVALAAIYQWKAKEFEKTQEKSVKTVRQTSQ